LMSLRAVGKKLRDTFNALIAPLVIARLETERDAAQHGYMLIRSRSSYHLYKIDQAAAQIIIDRANKRLEEWRPR
jgi:hypothetical protein